MKILLTGGTGFIGRELLKQLTTHEVTVLTRSPSRARQVLAHLKQGNLSFIDSLDDFHDLNPFDAVINLAGEPIADKRWTDTQKSLICESRWATDRAVGRLDSRKHRAALGISQWLCGGILR